MARIQRQYHRLSGVATLFLGFALALSGCASAAATTTGGPTATSGAVSASPTTAAGAATATPASAPPHAFAWYQFDSQQAPQIWASINGAAPTQITHIAPPPANGCNTEGAWSLPVFSPDLTHIVSALGSYQCGDSEMYGPISVINVAGGAISVVPGGSSSSNVRLTERTAGWLTSSEIWFVADAGNIYTYQLGAASAIPLPGVANAVEAVVRGTTLFWVSQAVASPTWTYTLHRYDLNAQAALPGSVSLGSAGTCACSSGDLHTPGWDASPDGGHIVYQAVTPSNAFAGAIASSHIYYANADGSGAIQIARYMVTNQLVKLQISPNGQWVAFTNALPSPATLTASVSSPGGAGDSTFHGYSPDTYNYPVWKWDSSQFWAGSIDAADSTPLSHAALYQFTLGGSSVVGVAGGFNPWYTIGG